MSPPHLRYFTPNHREWDELANKRVSERLVQLGATGNVQVESESCFHVILAEGTDVAAFEAAHFEHLAWLLGHNPFHVVLAKESSVRRGANVFEIGPRLNFTTPYSTNAVSACQSSGIAEIVRLEKSTIFHIKAENLAELDRNDVVNVLGDRMTECEYDEKLTFEAQHKKDAWFTIDVLADPKNLDKANKEMGLALDQSDIDYYLDLFCNQLKRNPTDVELFDLAQSNSEHSRHWFFKGRFVVDGVEREKNLFQIIQGTQDTSNPNNVIAFHDNSSSIKGFPVTKVVSDQPDRFSKLKTKNGTRHIIYSAETHNFPTGVSPFPGAATGTGGRIRDVHSTGRGAHEVAGVAGYSFGNLHLDNYDLPWESDDSYPPNMAHPREVAIEASNGASDYGNKFGEPVITGFARSFGGHLANGERCEYVKPIMFSGGLGSIDAALVDKQPCKPGMLLAKIGGPVYRIGLGGGAASSVHVQGGRECELDFGAVQRGDAEMEQKLHRIVRACIEFDEENPILSIHDQGAGGNGNVLKELVEGDMGGAIISADKFELGDKTISIRELWGAEYQENSAILLDPKKVDVILRIAKREKCTVSIVGEVTGDNKVVLTDFNTKERNGAPVNLDLKALGERPNKVFNMTTVANNLKPLDLPAGLTVRQGLELVLRLPSVASKRYLTNKVDRSVTGLIAQQQCVGPLHTPVADVAVTALSFFDKVGAAVAVGEQPVKGLVCAEAGARMSLAEALTNLVFAPISDLRDVKCSGNWMWAAKLPGEGAKLAKACDALCVAMGVLGVAIDGGKDSLSMAAMVGSEVVKAPGTLVISAYAPCTDITKVVTPDLKGYGNEPTSLVYVRFGNDGTAHRLGGSALAQCLKQVGDTSTDIDDLPKFDSAFRTLQQLINEGHILAGHDVSDGGLVTAVLEMAFAGNRSINCNMNSKADALSTLFAEEAGVVLEVASSSVQHVAEAFTAHSIPVEIIGFTAAEFGPDASVLIVVNDETVVEERLVSLRGVWEETSTRLELLQTSHAHVDEQTAFLSKATVVDYKADFEFGAAEKVGAGPYKVAILREEGSNGDREMAAAFMLAGFETFDVTMTDIMADVSILEQFNGIAFVGGFSYADVLGSSKGWASAIRFNPQVLEAFSKFKVRPDTFSFGVCNGCQLMGLLGWVGAKNSEPHVFLDENACGRYQSSFITVKVEKNPAIMLQGMENAVLGAWTSHGEGRFTYRTPAFLDELKASNLVCIRYTDGQGAPVMTYPENPNGSEYSVAGICSEDGRHLAMMPHPDRSFLSWQWPNYPAELGSDSASTSPWIKIFHNAYKWLETLKH